MTTSPSFELSFDTRVYRLTALKKAAYRFGDRCHIHLYPGPDTQVTVTLRAKDPQLNLLRLAGEYQNEVLDQDLREIVAEETAGICNLLLAQAFSATNLIDKHADTGDYKLDPAHIGTASPVPCPKA